MMITTAGADERNIYLSPGFMPDPVQRTYVSGGGVEASQMFGTDMRGNSCSGSVSSSADHVMTLDERFDYLSIWTTSDADTTLVVDGPGRFLLCDDDGGEGLNERIEHNDWPPGEYRIHVGSYGGGVHGYELFVSELGAGSAPTVTTDNRNISIAPGFTPDPLQVSFVSGGEQDAAAIYGNDMRGQQCSGSVANIADHVLTLQDDFAYLQLWTRSEGDTTLIVDGPGKFLLCDDDGGSSLNEHIEYEQWPMGEYRVYVGSYDDDYVDYQLLLSELRSEGPGY